MHLLKDITSLLRSCSDIRILMTWVQISLSYVSINNVHQFIILPTNIILTVVTPLERVNSVFHCPYFQCRVMSPRLIDVNVICTLPRAPRHLIPTGPNHQGPISLTWSGSPIFPLSISQTFNLYVQILLSDP